MVQGHRHLAGRGLVEQELVERVTVLVVADDPQVVERLMECIESDSTLSVVGTAARMPDAITKARLWQPEVALLDLSVADGTAWAAARGLHRNCPDIRLVAYASADTGPSTRSMAAAGISSCVSPNADVQTLIAAIRDDDDLALPRGTPLTSLSGAVASGIRPRLGAAGPTA